MMTGRLAEVAPKWMKVGASGRVHQCVEVCGDSGFGGFEAVAGALLAGFSVDLPEKKRLLSNLI